MTRDGANRAIGSLVVNAMATDMPLCRCLAQHGMPTEELLSNLDALAAAEGDNGPRVLSIPRFAAENLRRAIEIEKGAAT